MKFLQLLFLFIAITSQSFCQIRKGQWLLGGSLRFESADQKYSLFNNTYKSNNFFISPDIGYFVTNKLAGGLRIDFSSYNPKADSVETHLTSTTFSPFVRYYLLPVHKKVNVFFDLSYVHTKSKWQSFSNPPSYGNSNGFQISAGPSMFLTDQIALEFMLAFRRTTSNDPVLEPAQLNKLSTGLGLQIHLGKNKTKKTA